MPPLEPHAVHRLHQYRKSIATKTYAARGRNQNRCELCLLAKPLCTCEHRTLLDSQAAFLLLMYDHEVLKPSNSGRLIADLIPDTHAFLWSRTEQDPDMLAVLNDEQFQPVVVFPSEYARENQRVISDWDENLLEGGKRPLFILLDGSWRQAVKMFRKSPYLHDLPLLSFTPESVAMYGLRKGSRDFQMGTAEVAALALNAMGETGNGASLNAWFDWFIESSIYARTSRRVENLRCLEQLKSVYLDSLAR